MGQPSERLKLTGREMDVLYVLLKSDKPLIASEIAKEIPRQTPNAVQTILRSLLAKDFVKIDDIVFSGTVLSRSYVATELSKEYLLSNIAKQYEELRQCMSMSQVLNALLDHENDNLDAIERLRADVGEE